MNIIQKEITLIPRKRGIYLITDEIITKFPEIDDFSAGTIHLLLKHTSASLTLNENADPDVRTDLKSILNRIVPENQAYYTHTLEGPDDMPAHAKSSLFGAELTLPITRGRLNLGTWQGIYLCEYRNSPSRRIIAATLIGKSF